jgi:hypothetical protein
MSVFSGVVLGRQVEHRRVACARQSASVAPRCQKAGAVLSDFSEPHAGLRALNAAPRRLAEHDHVALHRHPTHSI